MLSLQPWNLNVLYLESVCLPGSGQQAAQMLKRTVVDLLSPTRNIVQGTRLLRQEDVTGSQSGTLAQGEDK